MQDVINVVSGFRLRQLTLACLQRCQAMGRVRAAGGVTVVALQVCSGEVLAGPRAFQKIWLTVHDMCDSMDMLKGGAGTTLLQWMSAKSFLNTAVCPTLLAQSHSKTTSLIYLPNSLDVL